MTKPCTLALALAGWLAAAAVGQQPDAIGPLTSLNRPPTPEEKDKIDKYVDYWAPRLARKDDPAAIHDARGSILQLLEGRPTDIFRDHYTRALLPRLREVLADKQQYLGAVNAVQIMGQLGTADAFREIQRYCHMNNEERTFVRVWAARGTAMLLEDTSEQIIERAERSRAVRDLHAAASVETEWEAMVAQVAAIASIASLNRVDVLLGTWPANPAEPGAIEAVLQRLSKQSEASELMMAVRRGLVILRELFLEQRDPAGKQLMGQRIMPKLVLLLEVTEKHWESAQKDSEHKRTYQAALKAAETLMAIIDANLGQSSIRETQFAEAFESDNYEHFHREVDRIQGITDKPPYR